MAGSNEAEGACGGRQGQAIASGRRRSGFRRKWGGEGTGSQAGGSAPRGEMFARRGAGYGRLS